jgi:hypothetical protein
MRNLFERYNELLDRARLKSLHGRSDPEKGQEVADQLGVQAVARAGYSPQAFPDFLDRLMETKGSTGSWLSDLFSTTRPSSKRLRLALRDVTSLPKSCIEKNPPARDLDKFHEWQRVVLHYNGIGHAEHLPKSVARVTLNDPLRGDIETFRFSSDGKYLLAQDDGGIYVILREPLQYMFRIDATDAGPAQFSPDAHHVVFFNHSQRVETWDVQSREQVSLDDVPAIHGCRDTALSADARYLACFTGNFSLVVYDVPSGETVLQVDRFFDMGGTDALHQFYFELFSALVHGKLVALRFSPDGRYFAASSRSDQGVLFDLIARRKLSVSGPLSKAMQYAFTFVGQDHIVGVNRDHPERSPLIELPSQKVVDQMPLGGDTLFPATSAQFIFAGPIKDHPLGAYDLNQKKIVFGNRSTAADIWNGVAVSERLNGELGLYKLVKQDQPRR